MTTASTTRIVIKRLALLDDLPAAGALAAGVAVKAGVAAGNGERDEPEAGFWSESDISRDRNKAA
jgi:hypothetical protein